MNTCQQKNFSPCPHYRTQCGTHSQAHGSKEMAAQILPFTMLLQLVLYTSITYKAKEGNSSSL